MPAVHLLKYHVLVNVCLLDLICLEFISRHIVSVTLYIFSINLTIICFILLVWVF